MTDDRRKRRAASVMGDDDRALVGRDRRPQEYPVHVDPELTPPPQAPPMPAAYDTLPPATRVVVDTLRDGQQTLADAVARVWDARQDNSRLEKLGDKVDALAEDFAGMRAHIDLFLRPAVAGSLMPRMDSVERTAYRTEIEQQPLVAAVEKLTIAIGRLEERFGLLERNVERLTIADTALGERIATQAAAVAELTERISALELVRVQTDAGVAAVTALTTKQKAARGALLAGATAIATGVFELVKWLLSR
jgi:chromosome segregation ATPase